MTTKSDDLAAQVREALRAVIDPELAPDAKVAAK